MDGCRRLSEVLPPDSEAIYVLPRDFVHPAKRYPLFFFLVLFFPYMWLSASFLDSIVAASHSCFHKARKAMAEGELSNGRGADGNVSIECLPESVTDISTTVAFVCPWFSTFLSTFYCMDLFGMLLGGARSRFTGEYGLGLGHEVCSRERLSCYSLPGHGWSRVALWAPADAGGNQILLVGQLYFCARWKIEGRESCFFHCYD